MENDFQQPRGGKSFLSEQLFFSRCPI